MATITIEVNDSKAMRLIQDLAELNIIQIVKSATITTKKTNSQKADSSLPNWQKKLLDQRISTLEEDKKNAVDIDDAINSISTELGI